MGLNSDKRFYKWLFRFLRFICPDHLYEEIEGDLVQKFNKDLQSYGSRTANRKLINSTLRFFRPGIIFRNKFSVSFNGMSMFKHYLKTTYRHIGRSKVNFAFKLGGLTLAFFSLLIIATYVHHQKSFDTFHEKHENIYRVNSGRYEDGKIVPYAMVPPAVGPALKEMFQEVVAYARTGVPSRVMIRYKDKLLRLTGFLEADSSIFNVLSFEFVRGNKGALSQPGSIVLTQSLATQLFGDEDPIDQVVTSPDHSNQPLNVTGIVKDFPTNSHLAIRAIYSRGAFGFPDDTDSWKIAWDGSVNLYVRLSSDANPDELEKKSLAVLRANIVSTEVDGAKKFSIDLQPIADIYLDEALRMEFSKKGNPLYVYVFLLLGGFLLIIACTNYINLSVADFDTRMHEIGVRKVLGAKKRQIGYQVVLESASMAFIALFIAVLLLYLFFPAMSDLLDVDLRFEMLTDPFIASVIITILLVVVIFSSAYPAYRLSVLKPAEELRSNTGHGNMRTGKALLLVQYIISIACGCFTVVIGKQIAFVQERDLGYDRERVVSLIMPDEYPPEKAPLLKHEISRLAGVENASYSYYLMPGSTYFKGWYTIEKEGKMEKAFLNEMYVDHEYFDVMGIKLIAGRNFLANNLSETRTAFIINETAAKEFGWTEPVGKRIIAGSEQNNSSRFEGTVVGVVKDFNSLSLHKKIEPVLLRLQYDKWPGNSLNVKTKGQLSDILPSIIATYEKVLPGFLADARILEDLYQRQYQEEDRAFASLQVGSIVIILISSLGVFSLSLYMSVRRMKEFGIRKVVGATGRQIAMLHLNYFTKIILTANFISLPVSYWLVMQWLDNFAYKTDLNALLFLSVMAISFVLAIFSGAYSALKASRINPVEVIKTR